MREQVRVADILESLTLEEKASLLSGGGAWETAPGRAPGDRAGHADRRAARCPQAG